MTNVMTPKLHRRPSNKNLSRLVALVTAISFSLSVSAAPINIPAGTVIYGETEKEVISKKKKFTVGDIIPAHVWRNVYVDGQVVISAGSPLMLRVSHLKTAKMAGIKGDLELELFSVRAVDGTDLYLDGGYDKSGKGSKVLISTLFLFIAWPLIFIKGKHARLPSGTVFDGKTEADVTINIDASSRRILNLKQTADATVEILYDDIEEAEDKNKATLPMRMTSCDDAIIDPQILKVNNESIEPIQLEIVSTSTTESNCSQLVVAVPLKGLAKTFKKGINTFTVQFGETEIEVILEVEL